MYCWLDGKQLEKNCDTSWLQNGQDCLQKGKLARFGLGEKQIQTIRHIEIYFFLDSQNVHNNETFEMTNTWIAAKNYWIGLLWVQAKISYELVTTKDLDKIIDKFLSKTSNFLPPMLLITSPLFTDSSINCFFENFYSDLDFFLPAWVYLLLFAPIPPTWILRKQPKRKATSLHCY